MDNIVLFGPTHSGKTTLLGYLSTSMLRHPQWNEEIYKKLKLILSLTENDIFNIKDPRNPDNMNTDIIFPSFVSLDRNELKRFNKGESSEGTSKRLQRKQLTVCVTKRDEMWGADNRNLTCTFIDIPGFRQRLTDKYKGFFEGNIGIAVLDIQDLLKLSSMAAVRTGDPGAKEKEHLKRTLFEPIKIWCDYRSVSRLIIVLSKMDTIAANESAPEKIREEKNSAVKAAVDCLGKYLIDAVRGTGPDCPILLSPVSVNIYHEECTDRRLPMSRFFKRVEENIYTSPVWGDYEPVYTYAENEADTDGLYFSCRSLISNLQDLMSDPTDSGVSERKEFLMASVDKAVRIKRPGKPTGTAVQVQALHGDITRLTPKASDKDVAAQLVMGPVRCRKDNSVIFVDCTVQSLKVAGAKEPGDVLYQGNIGGVAFSRVCERGTTSSLDFSYDAAVSDILILKNTILFAGREKQGDIVQVVINEDDYLTVSGTIDEIYTRVLASVMPYDTLFAYWYGKRLLVKVVEIDFSEKKTLLSLYIAEQNGRQCSGFVLPCRENGDIAVNDDLLIAVPETIYSDEKLIQGKDQRYTYISAAICDIKRSLDYNAIEIEAREDLDIELLLAENLPVRRENDYEQEHDIISLPIRNKNKQYSINSILTSVGRSIRWCLYRSFYRECKGVKMTLVNKWEYEA